MSSPTTLRCPAAFGTALALALVTTSPGNAQRPAQHDSSVTTLQQNLPAWMEQGAIPGLSVAVIRNGKTEWIGNFGVADKATARPVNDRTLFNAASLSKTVFAWAVLQLVDEGRMDLDTPLTRYLPDPIIKDPQLEQITARVVLSHRTGFPNWRPDDGELKIFFPPGQRFSYSGEGMVYLQKAVEAIEGKPLNDVMQTLVFTPLGMTESSYIWQPAWAADAATGYNSIGAGSPIFVNTSGNAAASLNTTAHDYALFLEAVLNGRGLKPATLRAMETPQIAVDPSCTNCTTHTANTLSTDLFWGLGWGIEQNASGKYIWHWGDNGIFKAYVVADVNRKAAVVMFDNSDTGLSIANAVVQTVLGGDHPSFAWLRYDTYDSGNMRFTRELATRGAVQSLADFTADIASGKISPSALNAAGFTLLRQKQYADAIAIFQRNVDLHPKSPTLYNSLGEAYVARGDTALAITTYEKELALDPANGNAKDILAKLRSAPAPK
jgi:CubicO group peptidase (beta-lactamase class C family)